MQADEVMYVDESGNQIAPPGGSSIQHPPYVAPRGDKADLLEKIKPDLIVDVIRHRLMGEEYIDGNWQQVSTLRARAVTEECAWDIANLMLAVSSQNVVISKLKDHEIKLRALSIARSAQEMLLRNWMRYGIRGTDQLQFVHEIVFSNSFITLKQSENEGIRSLLKGTTSEQRSVQLNQEPRDRRRWGLFRR